MVDTIFLRIFSYNYSKCIRVLKCKLHLFLYAASLKISEKLNFGLEKKFFYCCFECNILAGVTIT